MAYPFHPRREFLKRVQRREVYATVNREAVSRQTWLRERDAEWSRTHSDHGYVAIPSSRRAPVVLLKKGIRYLAWLEHQETPAGPEGAPDLFAE